MTEARAKPTVAGLGIDVGAQAWRRSGHGDGAVEIAFAGELAGAGPQWVLMRVAGDPEGRVLVYDRNEWECFLDGVRGGEFDDAAGLTVPEDRGRGGARWALPGPSGPAFPP